jgi:hypothetical protein
VIVTTFDEDIRGLDTTNQGDRYFFGNVIKIIAPGPRPIKLIVTFISLLFL